LKCTRADPALASVATDPVRQAPQADVSSHPLQEERDIGRDEEVEVEPVELEVLEVDEVTEQSEGDGDLVCESGIPDDMLTSEQAEEDEFGF
jgi:hypothetical protein